ncbi:MAG TPA: carotenoid biosynthesis protein [Candidatus Nanopelagicaceae bacterium]
MSQRHYSPRGNRRTGISNRSQRFLNAVLAIAIILQIVYPLVNGEPLRIITLASIYFAAAAILLQAFFSFGIRYASTYLTVTFAFILATEQIGLRTGWPFGNYTFDPSLGFQIFGVPLVIPFIWLMMAHPLLVVARRVAQSWIFLYGGIAMMAWDLFLDPTMVAAHRWTWTFTGAHVPFEKEIPLSNAFGWLFVSMGLMALLNLVLPGERRKKSADFTVVDIFLSWTFVAGIIGNLFFFHRPGVAFIGGLFFGIILAPYAFSRWFGRP